MVNKKIAQRVSHIMDIARRMGEKVPGWEASSRIEEITIHYDGYSEPGYDVGESGMIATGNWNKVDTYNRETQTREVISNLPARLYDLLTKLGVECEWSDEFSTCAECSKLFRTSGDSYCWQPSYAATDDGYLCHECLKEDPESHLLSLEGEDRTCNTISSINPAEHGYVKLEECETGWHPGQNDDPKKIAKELRAKGITRFLFNMDDVGQFDAKWSVWVYPTSEEVSDD